MGQPRVGLLPAADLRVDFLDETGAFIEAMPFPATAYTDRTALLRAIRTEGLEL